MRLVGREYEMQWLEKRLKARESCAIFGRPGCGKSKLITEALERSSPGLRVTRLRFRSPLHPLLVTLAGEVLPSQMGLVKRTSLHLKGLLWKELENNPHTIVLDEVHAAGPPTYRFLQKLFHAPGMNLVVSASDLATMGSLQKLFWDPRIALVLPPLHEKNARELFNEASRQFGLGTEPDFENFRERTLESTRGNPGQIVEMCRLAADPRYRSSGFLHYSLIRIDTITRFVG